MSTAQRVILVVGMGAAYPVILTLLYAYGDYVSLLSLAAAKQFSSPIALRVTFSVLSALCWALVAGVVFGVPLGLAVRSTLFRYWLVFVLAGAASQLSVQLPAGLGIDFFIGEWSLPEVWLNLAAVLAVAALIVHLKQPHAPAIEIAP